MEEGEENEEKTIVPPEVETVEDGGESSELDGLNIAFDSLVGESAAIRLFRKTLGSNKLGYLDDYSPGLFSLANIRDKYGGGIYCAQGVTSAGRIVKRVNFHIDEYFKPKISAPESLPVAIAGQAMDSSKFLEIMMLQQKESRDSLMMMMQGMMTVMASAMGGRKEEGMDFVKIISLMKTLQPPDNSVKMIEMMKQGIELGQLTSKEPKEEGFWEGMAKSVAPVMLPMLFGGGQPPAAQVTTAKPVDQTEMLILDVNNIINHLARSAQSKVDPQTLALDVIERAEKMQTKYPETVSMDKGLEFLEREDWFVLIAQKAPMLAPHAEYLQKVRDLILSEFSEVDPEKKDGTPDANSDIE